MDPERILLIGSGAGASLVSYPQTSHIPPYNRESDSLTDAISQAASVALKARDKGTTGIVGQVLDFPMTCHPKLYPQGGGGRLELRSYEQNADATTISSPLVDLFYDTYVPESSTEKAAAAYHSPLMAPSLAHMPPARRSR